MVQSVPFAVVFANIWKMVAVTYENCDLKNSRQETHARYLLCLPFLPCCPVPRSRFSQLEQTHALAEKEEEVGRAEEPPDVWG